MLLVKLLDVGAGKSVTEGMRIDVAIDVAIACPTCYFTHPWASAVQVAETKPDSLTSPASKPSTEGIDFASNFSA